MAGRVSDVAHSGKGSLGRWRPPKHAFTISIGSKSGEGRIGSAAFVSVTAVRTMLARAGGRSGCSPDAAVSAMIIVRDAVIARIRAWQ